MERQEAKRLTDSPAGSSLTFEFNPDWMGVKSGLPSSIRLQVRAEQSLRPGGGCNRPPADAKRATVRTVLRPRLAEMHNHGRKVPLHVGGIAFVLCPLFVLVAAAPIGEEGQLLSGATALLLFLVGLTGLRQQATGLGLPTVITAVAIIFVTAVVAGTLLEISGVALGAPLVAVIAVVIYTSRWRAGDLSLLGLVLALGLGLAYVLDNIFYDDNGSSSDQAVPVVAAPSIFLAVWVLAHTRSIGRAARICVVLGVAMGICALIVALATRDLTFVVVAVPAGLLVGFGFVATGVGLIRLGTAPRGCSGSRQKSRRSG